MTCFITGIALSQDVYIYPNKGQSKDQMEQDKFQCYTWAKDQTGFDPMKAPAATAPQSETSVAGGAVKGAAGGALLGLGIGAIAGDAGKGAAIGAVSGGAIGGVRSHKKKKEEEQTQQQQAAQYSQNRNAYDRAYAACLEGRGYTVK
jgi:predicted lipid-binding transport protein (Tim44 family)